MKEIILSLVIPFFFCFKLNAQAQTINRMLPDSIASGKQGNFHVQGVAIDHDNAVIYFSFTDRLVKTDLSGNLIGSVTGFLGHLGDLDFDPKTGTIYGSLEYKNDAIGKGITSTLGANANINNGFYIALFDGSKITKPDMQAEETTGILRTVYLREPLLDYEASVIQGSVNSPHRFACSGIDGVTLGPAFGKSDDHSYYLYVAYGIYGDTSRHDNDFQVILKYDVRDWDQYGENLKQGQLHRSGPSKPEDKYFVKTGNTRYGIQNLAYDPLTGNFFVAVYSGQKPQFPNYDLFVIDGHIKPKNENVLFYDKKTKIKTLTLLDAGLRDKSTDIRGWHFKWGATGLCPLGNGYFYLSHNEKSKDGQQSTTLYKYRWIGNADTAFERIGL